LLLSLIFRRLQWRSQRIGFFCWRLVHGYPLSVATLWIAPLGAQDECDVPSATNWRDGQITKSMSILLAKNISLRDLLDAALLIRRPASIEGRIAIVTNVERGMRWTRLAHQTNAFVVDGEAVWS
jgi:hypothetical protein